MKLSHSKLSTIMTCPMTYYLTYIEGISKKVEKNAFFIGSAFHWGAEHNTEDLTEYFEKAGFKTRDTYTRDQLLPEAMCHGYLKHKDAIFGEILTNSETGEKYELLEETHEVYVTGTLQTNKNTPEHKFVGIVDLLMLTNKGFIIIDYKTSSYAPKWDSYLDQIYRYIFMVRTMFPDVPILKIGIINVRKASIRQKKTENESQFLNRLKLEYELFDDDYVNYHEYPVDSLDPVLIDDYIKNLSKQCDLAHYIDESKLRFINFSNAIGTYGPCEHYDIFYRTPDAHHLYKIWDKTYNKDTKTFDKYRDCLPLDMRVIDDVKVCNHYEYYEEAAKKCQTHEFAIIKDFLYTCYDVLDDDLLKRYNETFLEDLRETD